jgi:hypothetical protein
MSNPPPPPSSSSHKATAARYFSSKDYKNAYLSYSLSLSSSDGLEEPLALLSNMVICNTFLNLDVSALCLYALNAITSPYKEYIVSKVKKEILDDVVLSQVNIVKLTNTVYNATTKPIINKIVYNYLNWLYSTDVFQDEDLKVCMLFH